MRNSKYLSCSHFSPLKEIPDQITRITPSGETDGGAGWRPPPLAGHFEVLDPLSPHC